MHHRLSLVVVTALVATASACTGPTGIKGSKKISELSADERKEACENAAAYFEAEVGVERIQRTLCVATSVGPVLLSGGGVAECEAAVDLCLMNPPMESGTTTCVFDNDQSCEATIEEWETCYDDQIAAIIKVNDATTCEAAINGTIPEPDYGANCMALAQKCPGLFSNQGEGA